MANSSCTPVTRPSVTVKPAVVSFWRLLRQFTRKHGRYAAALTFVLSLLAVINLTREFGPTGSGLIVGPVIALVLIGFSRSWGLTWSDLGLSRHTLARGAATAAIVATAVAVVYTVAALLPATRMAFLDGRYQLPLDKALVTAFVLIPLGTVLPEEIAFRSVLQGMITHHRGTHWGLGLSSALFGIWHILPSLGLSQVNPAVSSLVGNGASAQFLAVLGAVIFTGFAGLLLGELRRRSGSLLASGGLHWAVNGLGVLIAAALHGSA